ncbi:MAG: hypothetical protein JSV63_00275, partial [Candidatus Aenigmatarchaeota archaeon]
PVAKNGEAVRAETGVAIGSGRKYACDVWKKSELLKSGTRPTVKDATSVLLGALQASSYKDKCTGGQADVLVCEKGQGMRLYRRVMPLDGSSRLSTGEVAGEMLSGAYDYFTSDADLMKLTRGAMQYPIVGRIREHGASETAAEVMPFTHPRLKPYLVETIIEQDDAESAKKAVRQGRLPERSIRDLKGLICENGHSDVLEAWEDV